VDLTPRAAPAVRRRRRAPSTVMLSVVLVAVAFLLFKFLTSATMYFCDADQVGVKSECSGDKRFRLRGAVVEGTVKNTADGVDFDVVLNGKTIHVRHTGSPPQLFREGIQVVVEGKLVADAPATFASDQLLVKHGEEYRKKNPGRVPADAP
jgi:cytochrome c-type biogenesis protein CcmE